jgi:hypothetical protein
MSGGSAWIDLASVQVLRDILIAAQVAFDPENSPEVPWPDTFDPTSGAYRRNAMRQLADPMAESIIGVIHDEFAGEEGRLADRVAAVIRELRVDRDRLTRILAVLDQERARLQDGE